MSSKKEPAYHLAGVAGVGMSALAQALLAGGYAVSGSDRYLDAGHRLPILEQLAGLGVRLVPQDGSGVTPETGALVVSTALESDNPDIAAARSRGVPVRHRAEVLAALAGEGQCVAVTGTSGKSTVTGMLGWALAEMGAAPTVVNGAAVLNWCTDSLPGNFVPGGSGLWVVEADESDRSLMHFHPDWAVITNASRDHFGAAETRALFDAFRGQVRRGVVDGMSDPDLVPQAEPTLSPDGSVFRWRDVSFELRVPGRHNVENAIQAAALCERLGYAPARVRAALGRFRGLHRRLELHGRERGVRVYDDYAHNPAKIAAAWSAVRPPDGRVHAVWRPHGYGPLRAMMEELVAAFAALAREGDRVFLLPVYDAGGTADRHVGSGELVERLSAAGVAAEGLDDYAGACERVPGGAGEGDVVLLMGARDPDLPVLADRLLEGLRG
jgi:UDP-N-acetylmuramate--alanine ligase